MDRVFGDVPGTLALDLLKDMTRRVCLSLQDNLNKLRLFKRVKSDDACAFTIYLYDANINHML